MKVTTLNVNGLRAAARKGFFSWMQAEQPDIVCLQEIKAQEDQLTDPIFHPKGYFRSIYPAQRKGYSGVAIYCRKEPNRIIYGLNWEPADQEGRYLQVDFDQISISSLYLPSGTSGEERQAFKFKFLDTYWNILQSTVLTSDRDFILTGDWNIAHKKIDLKNWSSNQKHSGFLPEERLWMDRLFAEDALVDAFRVINQQSEQYTWWSNFGQAWAKNVGWRIDYHVITPSLAHRVRHAEIYKEQRFSDHAPLTIDYEYILQ